jgi:hypothetical protein
MATFCLFVNYWNYDSMVYKIQIQEAVEAIVSTIHPISIVLFGSVAREGKGNDLYLMHKILIGG